MQALGDNGQGLVNFILFVLLTRKVRNLIASFAARRLCCCITSRRISYEHLDDEKEDEFVRSVNLGSRDSHANGQETVSDSRSEQIQFPGSLARKSLPSTADNLGQSESQQLGQSSAVQYGSVAS